MGKPDDLQRPTPSIILAEVSGQKWRMANYFGVSLEMVGKLPSLARQNTTSEIWVACFESFLTHVRAIAEFLVRRPSEDFTAADFSSWPVPTSEAALRLRDVHWVIATKHVMHFSHERVPPDLPDPIDPFECMDDAARDVFSVAEEFVSAVEREEGDLAVKFRLDLDMGRARFVSPTRL